MRPEYSTSTRDSTNAYWFIEFAKGTARFIALIGLLSLARDPTDYQHYVAATVCLWFGAIFGWWSYRQ